MSLVFYDDGYPEASEYDSNYEWREVVTPRTRRIRRVVPGQVRKAPIITGSVPCRRPACRLMRTLKQLLSA